MTPCYWCYFCIFFLYIAFFFPYHNGFLLLLLALISILFENSNFPFKIKYVNTEVYPVNSNYFIHEGKITRGKQENYCWSNSLINSTMYFFNILPKPMNFEGSPNSLWKNYFTREFRLEDWGSLNSPLYRPINCWEK